MSLSRAFDFRMGDNRAWAQSHPCAHPLVTLYLRIGSLPSLCTSATLTAADARAMAAALEAAATHAESTLPTGLGESEAAA